MECGAVESQDGKLKFAVFTELKQMLSLQSLAEQALVESRFSYFTFSPEKFQILADNAAQDTKRHGVLVASLECKPVGFCYCTLGGLAIGEGAFLTTVSLFFIPIHIRQTLLGGRIANGLLAGLESWTVARSGREILFHVNFGGASERTHRFLKRRGFATVGGSYVKGV